MSFLFFILESKLGKVKRLFLFLFGLYTIQVSAQSICGQNRYLEETFSNVELTTGIEYGSADPYGLINNQTLRLDIYEPEGDTLEKRPFLIHAFGGGFLIGARNEPDIPNWGTQYAKRGFVFVSIDYRLGFNVTDQNSAVRAAYRAAQDMRAALRFLADSAEVYRLDMDNVFLTGSSAGCFAALIQTFMKESDRPASTYGTLLEPQDLGCANCSGNNNNNNQEVPVHGIVNNWGALLDTAFINLATDPADDVPVISFHGTNDLIVPYSSGYPFSVPVFPVVHGSELIHHRLDEQGIYNRLYPLIGLGHEPELTNPWVTDTIVENAAAFLYELMRPQTDAIIGKKSACQGDVETYSVSAHPNSHYCWEIVGANLLNENHNSIEVEWLSVGQGSISVVEYNAIHAKTNQEIEVSVGLEPNADFNYNSTDGLFDFSASDSSGQNYFWDFGDGNSSLLENPQHQYSDTGSFVVEYLISNAYCSRSKSDTVVSDLCPEADFTVEAIDSHAYISNHSQFGTDALWDFGNGLTYSGFEPHALYDENGNYPIQLILSNAFCSDTFSTVVEIVHCPIADFEISSNALEIEIYNHSSNNFLNYWDFGNGNASRQENPVQLFDSAGIYEISLIVFNSKNCSDTLSKLIYLEEDTATVGIHEIQDYVLEIYPVPSSGLLNIDLGQGASAFVSLSIWNLGGSQIYYSESIDNPLNIAHLADGIYLLKIKMKNQVLIRKIVKT
ncbi:MAG: PKD domain-containing protein [Chitinophagales bacterium]